MNRVLHAQLWCYYEEADYPDDAVQHDLPAIENRLRNALYQFSQAFSRTDAEARIFEAEDGDGEL